MAFILNKVGLYYKPVLFDLAYFTTESVAENIIFFFTFLASDGGTTQQDFFIGINKMIPRTASRGREESNLMHFGQVSQTS